MAHFKDSIQCEQIMWSNGIHLECLGLKVTLSPQMVFTIVVLYRSPHAKNEFYEQLWSLLKECDLGKELLSMGDFNINWEDKLQRKSLKQIYNGLDFHQLIKGLTRVTNSSKTQIDLVFSNKPERADMWHIFSVV